jgi:hypothetical protein
MSDTAALPNRAKKGVGLSGVTAGNTALCTVGRTGNDLHYRGYDILEFADRAEFEEIAYLLVHGKLPNAAELSAYKTKLKALRGIPAAVQDALADEGLLASTDGRDGELVVPMTWRRRPRSLTAGTAEPSAEASQHEEDR